MTDKKIINDNSDVDELPDIFNQLKESVSGHVAAYKDLLSPKGSARLEKLYSEFAQKEWAKIYKADPDDWVACHHLAIMYHAKAFDLEAHGKTSQAKENWQLSHKFWFKLFRLNQPIKKIQAGVKKMDVYKPEKHDQFFENLKNQLSRDLLDIHRRLYDHYSSKDRIKADCHYDIIENSPIPQAAEILRILYEERYGTQVKAVTARLAQLNSDEKKIKEYNKVRELIKNLKLLSQKRSTLSPVLRDLIILQSWNLKIQNYILFREYRNFENSMRADLKHFDKMGKKLQDTGARCEEFAAKARSEELSFSKTQEYSDLVDEHNNMVHKQKRILEKLQNGRKKIIETLSDFSDPLDECKALLSSLNPLNDAAAMQVALVELQSALSISKDLSNFKKEAEEQPGVLTFFKKLNESIQLVNRYFSTTHTPKKPADGQCDAGKNIWHWDKFKIEDIPYMNTSFILLEEELPPLNNNANIKNQIKKLKIKKKNLERKTKAGKHNVFGRKIKIEALNIVGKTLNDPMAMAGDMLLQHQAHHADLENVKEKLAKIELPSQDSVLFELSPSLFSLLHRPKPATLENNSWKKPVLEKPPPPEPKIDWPT